MGIKEIYFPSVKEWRLWLEKNHLDEKKVGVICYKKHTGKPSMTHREAMEEAICFGWIDTTIKRLDGDRYLRYFCKRGKNSRWSNATLGYAKDLKKRGKMSSFGLKIYGEGRKKPVIDHGIGKNPEIPEILKVALDKNGVAMDRFEKLAPSYRRMFIISVMTAKREETKEKRVKEIIERLISGKKPYE